MKINLSLFYLALLSLSPIIFLEANLLQLSLKTPTGKIIMIDAIESNSTIKELKELVEKKEKIPVERQCYIFDKTKLEENRTLSDYRISNKSQLSILLRKEPVDRFDYEFYLSGSLFLALAGLGAYFLSNQFARFL